MCQNSSNSFSSHAGGLSVFSASCYVISVPLFSRSLMMTVLQFYLKFLIVLFFFSEISFCYLKSGKKRQL